MLHLSMRILRRLNIVAIMLAGLLGPIDDAPAAPSEPSYSAFLQAVDSNEVSDVTIEGERLVWTHRDGGAYTTIRPDDQDLIRRLVQHGVAITVVPESDNPILGILLAWLPMLLLIAVWAVVVLRMRRKRIWMPADLAEKLDQTNAHLARIEGMLAARFEGPATHTPPTQ